MWPSKLKQTLIHYTKKCTNEHNIISSVDLQHKKIIEKQYEIGK